MIDGCGSYRSINIYGKTHFAPLVIKCRNEVSQKSVSKYVKSLHVSIITHCNCTFVTVKVAIAQSITLWLDNVLIICNLYCQWLHFAPIVVTSIYISEAIIIEWTFTIEVWWCKHDHCLEYRIIARKHIQKAGSRVYYCQTRISLVNAVTVQFYICHFQCPPFIISIFQTFCYYLPYVAVCWCSSKCYWRLRIRIIYPKRRQWVLY